MVAFRADSGILVCTSRKLGLCVLSACIGRDIASVEGGESDRTASECILKTAQALNKNETTSCAASASEFIQLLWGGHVLKAAVLGLEPLAEISPTGNDSDHCERRSDSKLCQASLSGEAILFTEGVGRVVQPDLALTCRFSGAFCLTDFLTLLHVVRCVACGLQEASCAGKALRDPSPALLHGRFCPRASGSWPAGCVRLPRSPAA